MTRPRPNRGCDAMSVVPRPTPEHVASCLDEFQVLCSEGASGGHALPSGIDVISTLPESRALLGGMARGGCTVLHRIREG